MVLNNDDGRVGARHHTDESEHDHDHVGVVNTRFLECAKGAILKRGTVDMRMILHQTRILSTPPMSRTWRPWGVGRGLSGGVKPPSDSCLAVPRLHTQVAAGRSVASRRVWIAVAERPR